MAFQCANGTNMIPLCCTWQSRDRKGKIVKAAPYQSWVNSGTVARVAPNQKWFGNTKVVTQTALQNFQEELGKAMKDPYQVVMKQTKLPVTLLNEKAKILI